MDKSNTKLTIFFILVSILLVGAMALYIVSEINRPYLSSKQKVEMPSEEEILDYLKTIDTDKDGLSDFEEKFQYGTSIYISDTDSDGYSDKEEVKAGSSPLSVFSTPLHPERTEKIEPTFPEMVENQSGLQTPSIEKETEKTLEQEAPASDLRRFLIEQTGLSQEIVDKIDDKTLLEVYNKTKEETGIDIFQLESLLSQKQSNLDFSSQEGKAKEDLPNLDVEKLRQLLKDQGANPEVLDKIDDQTLLQLFSNLMRD